MGVLIFFAIAGLITLIFFHRFSESGAFSFRSFSKSKPEFRNAKLVGVLLGLETEAVEELLALYKKEFGKGAARYARKTYRKWKTGEVRPVTQTFERFLVHLPKVMSYDLKCEVLRAFMEEYAAKDNYELKIYTDDWEEKLTPLVEQIIDKTYTAQLPVEVERKLRWLGDGDMKLAQDILRKSQAEEGRIAVSTLREEFSNIEKLLAETHLKPRVTHELKFPYGTITLKIKRR
jgi:hypothetical protein